MAKIVGIKFRHAHKVYYFDPQGEFYKEGSGVVVETARGIEYGTVTIEPKEVSDNSVVQPLKPVLRRATAADEERVRSNEEKRPAAMKIASEKIAARGLNMKLIDCEFTFDGSKVVFYFSAVGRIDFRDLVKDLASTFHIRIELRQIGIRDETRMLGGLGPCGRECCCAGCMPDVKKVSIKMAKTQGLSLNPAKISGLCGRLMCCLEYEYNHYSETYKKMPKVGSEVTCPDGKATVVAVNMLKLTVHVKMENKGDWTYKDYPLDEIKFKKSAKDEEPDDTVDDEIKELID
ncbi:MAG: stage 0 sporulation family protein [Clostridia bacterium]|nr:stage 0 sporulation family protein [Clostridia bacterium]